MKQGLGRALFIIGLGVLLVAGPTNAQEAERTGPELLALLEEMRNRPATPNVLGAVRLDMTRLTLSTDPVTRGRNIFAGAADHAQVGRLSAEMNLRDALQNYNVPAGAPMFKVEFLTRRRLSRSTETAPGWTMTAVWCSTFGKRTVFGSPSPALCIIDNDPRLLVDRHRLAYTSLASREWLVTSPAAMPASLRATGFAIEPAPDDPFGSMDIRLELSSVRAREVRMTLFASKAGDDMVVMRFNVPVEAGVAVLPLWDHRLTLRVERNAVTPELTADGDGSSPIPLGAYPSG
jgi:hypothetical protein